MKYRRGSLQRWGAIVLVVAMTLMISACAPSNYMHNATSQNFGGSNQNNLLAKFEGNWILSDLKPYDEYELRISVTSSGVTIVGPDWDDGYFSEEFETYKLESYNGHPCLLFEDKESDFMFGYILINSEMLGAIHTEVDEDYCWIKIAGTKYQCEFSPMENVFIRKGSGTRNIPDFVEIPDDWGDVVYYPESNILHEEEEEAFYVYASGELELIENFTVPGANCIPYDAIYTNHDIVITDNT